MGPPLSRLHLPAPEGMFDADILLATVQLDAKRPMMAEHPDLP